MPRCGYLNAQCILVIPVKMFLACLALSLQPLKVVDPDHPLAALVRKAQADSPAPTPPTADGAAVQPSQVEYTTDCEYFVVRSQQGIKKI